MFQMPTSSDKVSKNDKKLKLLVDIFLGRNEWLYTSKWLWKSSKQFLSLFKHNPTSHLEHLTVHVISHFRQRERFPSTSGHCATLPNRMSATGDGTAGFLWICGFGEMLRLGRPSVLFRSLPARVNAEAVCVVKVIKFICNFFDISTFDIST